MRILSLTTVFCVLAPGLSAAAPSSDLSAFIFSADDPALVRGTEIAEAFFRDGGEAGVVVLLEKGGAGGGSGPVSLRERRLGEERFRALEDKALAVFPRGSFRLRHRYSAIPGFSGTVSPEGLEALLASGLAFSVEPETRIEACLRQGLALIGAERYRSRFDGAGVAVAVCDSGVDYRHPLLGGGGFPNLKVLGGYDFGDGDEDPSPGGSAHGTACAGIVAGAREDVGDYIGGVAPGAGIYALKITSGDSTSASSGDIVAAWDWCVRHRDDRPGQPLLVITLSFGGGKFASACDDYSPALTQAAAAARAAGITIFASAGNSGYCDSVCWPACVSGINPVGAVYDDAFGPIAPCVSQDSCRPDKIYTDGCSTSYYVLQESEPDLVAAYSNSWPLAVFLAPADRVQTLDIAGAGGYTDGDYYPGFGGTSAACPYAAGAAAVVQGASVFVNGTALAPSDLEALLCAAAVKVVDENTGQAASRIDLEKALCTLVEPFRDVVGDYSGDGTADVAIYRPRLGLWVVRGITRIWWGRSGDVPVPGDYDGDRTWEAAVFRPSAGQWEIRGAGSVYYGRTGDLPVPADYSGDGRCQPAVFRPSTGGWFVGGSSPLIFGGEGDTPLPADYDGDGRAEPAVYRAGLGKWMFPGCPPLYFGREDDLPVPADYDGDGRVDVAVYRAPSGRWLVRGVTGCSFGASGDLPVPADYDGDGTADIAVFRSGRCRWLVKDVLSAWFGVSGDLPVSGNLR
ncbi:MAG TPA: S8 family serine peptidase [bacterium]|nr:S8 family serine peptidase [bacterium]HPQ65679.1 S8 family serine peptidase [bacterium]